MDSNPSLERINHFIDREEARKLITAYREMQPKLLNPQFERLQKEFGVLPTSEAFNEKSILAILAQDGCVGIRIHYGLKQQDVKGETIPLIVAVLVGVASDGSNMWARSAVTEASRVALKMAVTSRGSEEDGVIVEDSQRCPPFGDSSPLP
ncbi:hypothetical protein [Flavitalea sp.]|nr:hypothetical protein [Flavitalea sp.]